MPRQDLRQVIAAYRKYGLTVEVVPGAETRGDPLFNPAVHVGHHTAGAKTGDRPSLRLCVEGRVDLDGPLCQDFLARSGVVVLVATGRANHAGLGSFRGVIGNSGASGTEAEDDGDGTWTDEQLWSYPRIVAARLDLIGRDASWYCSHRTWAANPLGGGWTGRKVDPTGIADDWMRSRVSPLLLASPSTPAPEEDPLAAITIDEIKTAVRQVLNEGTAGGQASWAATNKAILGTAQALVNLANEGAARDRSLAASITDARSAVLAAIATLDTAGLSQAERDELAAAIVAGVANLGLGLDEAAVSEALALNLAGRLAA